MFVLFCFVASEEEFSYFHFTYVFFLGGEQCCTLRILMIFLLFLEGGVRLMQAWKLKEDEASNTRERKRTA